MSKEERAQRLKEHRLHQRFQEAISHTVRVTQAMEAGISDHVWSVQDLIGLL
jgi:hypothetical protein